MQNAPLPRSLARRSPSENLDIQKISSDLNNHFSTIQLVVSRVLPDSIRQNEHRIVIQIKFQNSNQDSELENSKKVRLNYRTINSLLRFVCLTLSILQIGFCRVLTLRISICCVHFKSSDLSSLRFKVLFTV